MTISKSGYDRDGNELEESANPMIPRMFETYEIEEIAGDLNNYLQSQNSDFQVITSGEEQNLTYGFSTVTMGMGYIYPYQPEVQPPQEGQGQEDTLAEETQVPGDEPSQQDGEMILYTYTTPPYYSEENLIAGTMSGMDEIMLSSAALEFLGLENAEDIENGDYYVTLSINMTYDNMLIRINKPVKVTAIIDVSVFSNMMVMYLSYDFLNTCVMEAQINEGALPTGIKPSLLFIETDSKDTTDLINNYISTNRKDLSGSVEEQLASMFSEMMSTFSIGLAIISSISLLVALIMILVVLYMSVSERTREIGVLKSIGARKKDIKLIFSTESLLVGLLSGLTGIILALAIGGILIVILTAVLGFAPISMMWYYFVIALVISVVISVIAGLYPASKAAKLDPVESLRHE